MDKSAGMPPKRISSKRSMLTIFRLKNIKSKFVIPVLIALIIILSISEMIKFDVEVRNNKNDMNDKGNSISELAALSIVEPLWNYDAKGVSAIGKSLFKDKEVEYVKIVDSSGKTIYQQQTAKKGNAYLAVDKKVVKEGKEIGKLELHFTNAYRQVEQKNSLMLFWANLLAVCFFLGLIVNWIANKIVGPIREVTSIANRIAADDLSGEIVVNRSGDELEELTSAFHQMQQNLRTLSGLASSIAEGKLESSEAISEVNQKSGDLTNSFKTMHLNLQVLFGEINDLIMAFEEGRLSARGNVERLAGGYREIVQGLNRTLDAITEPIKETSKVLTELAKGNLHVEIQGNYQGEYAAMKDALNSTINALQSYIGELSDVLMRMSEGDLNLAIAGEYRGDFVQIKSSVNRIIESFNDMLRNILNAAEQVTAGAHQISVSSQNLAHTSTEQASTVEEINASLTEISSQIKLTAENAEKANRLSILAKESATSGNNRMADMLNAMAEIDKSSATISKIIKVIDEIAFQTNILALNAAVEAARAGQYGKGFAVVAEEVRNLAARSANAAKETTAMIEGSIKKVEVGTKIANETAEALDRILNSVTETSNLISDISNASTEESTGIVQVNQGITQVSQVTLSSTSLAEESAAASEELASQAEMLKAMVERFKLNQSNNALSSEIAVTRQETVAPESKSKRQRRMLEDLEFAKF